MTVPNRFCYCNTHGPTEGNDYFTIEVIDSHGRHVETWKTWPRHDADDPLGDALDLAATYGFPISLAHAYGEEGGDLWWHEGSRDIFTSLPDGWRVVWRGISKMQGAAA